MRPGLPQAAEALRVGGHIAWNYWFAQIDLGDLWGRAEVESRVGEWVLADEGEG